MAIANFGDFTRFRTTALCVCCHSFSPFIMSQLAMSICVWPLGQPFGHVSLLAMSMCVWPLSQTFSHVSLMAMYMCVWPLGQPFYQVSLLAMSMCVWPLRQPFYHVSLLAMSMCVWPLSQPFYQVSLLAMSMCVCVASRSAHLSSLSACHFYECVCVCGHSVSHFIMYLCLPYLCVSPVLSVCFTHLWLFVLCECVVYVRDCMCVFGCVYVYLHVHVCSAVCTYTFMYTCVRLCVWEQLDSSKSLVEQCVQGDGMVQINLEVKSQPGGQDGLRRPPPLSHCHPPVSCTPWDDQLVAHTMR